MLMSDSPETPQFVAHYSDAPKEIDTKCRICNNILPVVQLPWDKRLQGYTLSLPSGKLPALCGNSGDLLWCEPTFNHENLLSLRSGGRSLSVDKNLWVNKCFHTSPLKRPKIGQLQNSTNDASQMRTMGNISLAHLWSKGREIFWHHASHLFFSDPVQFPQKGLPFSEFKRVIQPSGACNRARIPRMGCSIAVTSGRRVSFWL